MKLLDLEPEWYRVVDDMSMTVVESLGEADGIRLLCPVCWLKNGGEVGTHSIICWFTGKVDVGRSPGPGRWNPSGTGFEDLTFVGPGATSVWLTGEGCGAHFLVEGGEIKLC